MAKLDWYPDSLGALRAWHANFAWVIGVNGATYGLSTEQVAQATTDATVVALIINYAEAMDATRKAVTEYREEMLAGDRFALPDDPPTPPSPPTLPAGARPGIEGRTRRLAAIIKASEGYTVAAGESMGLVRPGDGKPHGVRVRAVGVTGSQVALRFRKGGYRVLQIEGRRGGGGWEVIGVGLRAEYLDDRPPLVEDQPEVREYRVRGMKGSGGDGAYSPVARAVTQP